MKYYFKSEVGGYGFYPVNEETGKPPVGASQITKSDFDEYSDESNCPSGCKPEFDNGCMCWIEISINEYKKNKLLEVGAEHDTLYRAGFKSNGVDYSSSDDNRLRISQAKDNGGGLVVNGELMVILNASTSLTVHSDMLSYLSGLDQRLYNAQQEIQSSTTNEEVDAVVF